MSLINDALQKAERDRTGSSLRYPPARGMAPRRSVRQSPSTATVGLALLLVGGTAALVVFATRDRPAAPAAASVAVATEPPAVTVAPAAPAAISPFTPALPLPTEQPAPPSEFALAGMSVLGEETLISVLRQSDRRSVWVPVGKSVNGIAAISYDPAREQAVIRVDDALLTIRMSAAALAAQPAE